MPIVGSNIEHLTTTVWLRLSNAPPAQARKHSSRDFNCCDVIDVRWPERLSWSAFEEPNTAVRYHARGLSYRFRTTVVMSNGRLVWLAGTFSTAGQLAPPIAFWRRTTGRRASPRPADSSHLPAPFASAKEQIAAIGLQPRHAGSGWHLKPVEDFAGAGIDSPHIAFVAFPSTVPQLPVDPSNTGDEAIGLDGAKNRSCGGINLMDLSTPILPDPERPFSPCQPRVTTVAGRGDGAKHSTAFRIDLLDAIFGNLKQVLAVECGSCMRRDIN